MYMPDNPRIRIAEENEVPETTLPLPLLLPLLSKTAHLFGWDVPHRRAVKLGC